MDSKGQICSYDGGTSAQAKQNKTKVKPGVDFLAQVHLSLFFT